MKKEKKKNETKGIGGGKEKINLDPSSLSLGICYFFVIFF